MLGINSYCRTKEAIQWLEDGDVIQHLKNESYFKKENDRVYFSFDNIHWAPVGGPMEAFPPHDEWRSVTNFHYYSDLKEKQNDLWYLDFDDKVLSYVDPTTDKTKKRWFIGGVL